MTGKLFSRKTLAFCAERAKGKCELCGIVLKKGEGQGHHIKERAAGGDNSPENCLWICGPCHKPLTKKFTKGWRKAARVRDKHTGAIHTDHPMQSAGFQKTDRSPRIDKSALPPLPRRSVY